MSHGISDAERLEELELNATSAAVDLECLLEKQMEINLQVIRASAKLERLVRERDTFKAALEGMKDGKYAS